MILNEKINSFKAVVTSISIENTKIHLKILIQYEMSSRRFSNYIYISPLQVCLMVPFIG